MEYLPNILAAYGAFALAMMSPGPNILSIVGTAMGRSRREGLQVALGVSTGSALWATGAVLGLTALLAASAKLTVVMRILGGSYLIWLGIKSLRSAWRPTALEIAAIGERVP